MSRENDAIRRAGAGAAWNNIDTGGLTTGCEMCAYVPVYFETASLDNGSERKYQISFLFKWEGKGLKSTAHHESIAVAHFASNFSTSCEINDQQNAIMQATEKRNKLVTTCCRLV